VDNQLPAGEKARLEARLAREPELKAALAELRLTVRALRSLPTVRPPRNFTLTRAQAEAHTRTRFQVFPVLRLATAFAAFAFVLVVASDLFSVQRLAAPAAAPEVALSVAQVTPSPEGSGFAGGEPPSTSTTQTEVMAAQVVTSTEQTAATTPPPETTDRTTAPTATPDTRKAPRATLTSTPTPAAIAEAQEAGGDGAESAADAAASSTSQPPPSLPLLRYVEVGLAVLTALLAVATWWWRRR
jgi:hypothetical protein